VFLITSNPIP